MIKFLQKHRGTQGSVTILMLIIMLPMLVFSFTIVDVCKIFMAKDVAADASMLALNAGMTSYDKVLKDMYGILATSDTEEELSKKMSEYYSATLAANGLTDDNTDMEHLVTNLIGSIDDIGDDYKESVKNDNSYLKVEPEKVGDNYVSADAFDSSAASNPAVLERQIVEYMKYRGPAKMAEGIFDKLNALKDLPKQAAVTTSRMEFEQTLGDINNDAIDIYTKLQVYFHNNNRAETGNSELSIVYESEKQNIIKKYKYSGSAKKANGLFASNTDFQKIECKLKSASVAALIYAPFYDLMKNSDSKLQTINNGSTSSSGSTLASELKSSAKTLKNAKIGDLTFEQAVDVLSHSKDYAKALCQFDGAKWNKPSDTAIQNGYKLLSVIQAFSKYFRNGKGGTATNDLSVQIKEFLKNYEKAEKSANSSLTKDNDKKTLNEALSDSTVKSVYDKLDDAIDDMKELIPWLSEQANKQLTDAYSLIKEYYEFVSLQISLLDDLSGSDISKLVESFKSAKSQAGTYQNAINEVESDNQKNSAQQTWNNEAKDISELSESDAAALISELKSQKTYYEKVKNALLSMKVMTETVSNAPNAVKESFGSLKLTNDRVEKYCTNELLSKAPSSANSLSYMLDLPSYTNKGTSLGLSKWTDNNNSKITENSVYKEIVKLSEPSNDSKKDKSQKEKILENSKTSASADGDSPSLPGGVSADAKNEDGSSSSSSDEDKKAFEEMKNAEKFSAYIKNSDEANAVVKQSADISDSDMKVNASLDTSGSDKEISSNAISMIGSISKLMKQLEVILADGRDALFVTEYLTGNFSCHTTSMNGNGTRKNDAKMLSGELFYSKSDSKVVKNVGYGTELEYILYGLDTELANKAAAGGTIFGIRFVLNLIYSFTDAEIRSFTLSVATAATGWFPFAVPIVQTVLHIGLALAESAIDLTYLMNGASVPLYKSATTWYCKGTNIIRSTAAVVASKVADVAIDKAADVLCEKIGDTANNAKEWTAEKTAYINEKIDEIRGQIKNEIISPVNTVVQECMLNIQKYSDLANGKKLIEQKLNEAFAELETSLTSQSLLVSYGDEDDGENIVNDVTKSILNELKGKTSQMAAEISKNLESFVNASTNIDISGDDDGNGKLAELIDEKLTTVTNTINTYIGKAGEYTDKAAGKAKEFVTKLSNNMSNAIDEVAKSVKKGVQYTADELKNAINSKVTSSVTGHKNTTIIDGNGKVTTSAEHMLDMSYKDYMYVLTLIAVFANRDNILERSALLMQANCKIRGEDKDYTLNTARTFFSVKVGASTTTTFYGAVFKDGKLDMSAARKKYEFTYSNYMGY